MTREQWQKLRELVYDAKAIADQAPGEKIDFELSVRINRASVTAEECRDFIESIKPEEPRANEDAQPDVAQEDGEADHEGFFKRNGKCAIRLHYFGPSGSVDVEELYQAFRARMKAEG